MTPSRLGGEPQGFTSSADDDVGAIIELALGALDLHRLEAATLVDNVASSAVPRRAPRPRPSRRRL
jgi:hypothetical protein